MNAHRLPAPLLVTIVLCLAHTLAPSAHERIDAGRLRLTVGWGEEPAFSGSRNAVVVEVSDSNGQPVTDPAGVMLAEVAFGDERIMLPLLASGERRGEYRASLVPTRPGSYAFHITGTVRGQRIDFTSTCSDKTFDCVADMSDLQFPSKDPSIGQLALRMDRALPRADGAGAMAARARTMSIIAMALAAAALTVTIRRGVRRGGTSV